MRAEPADGRGISPVIGIAVLVVIVTILSATVGYVALGLADETDPQPNVALELKQTENNVTFVLRHRGGETLTGNKTALRGVGDEEALYGEEFGAGDEVEVVPVEEEVRLVWFGENTDHVVQTFDVDTSDIPHGIANIDRECSWAEQNINANGDLEMAGDSAVCDVREDISTGASNVDIDLDSGSVLVGDLDTDGDIDVDSSVVAGDVTTTSSDITITDNSDVYGDVIASPGTNIDIDGNSNVTGAVLVDGGSLSLDTVDIDGHVYANPGDVSGCSNAELGPDGKSCAAYSFREPSNYDG
jgi:FlaG/FlaF family flagellin (archaellin)/cytoskeletal protein CcmA (bactofilin family)